MNDNFIEHASRPESKGREIVEILRPGEDDYFVLKPKHSAFFSTTLDVLLDYLRVETVILTGIAANICVLFTANDAYMRDFHVVVPRDCVASNTEEVNRHALEDDGQGAQSRHVAIGGVGVPLRES